MDFVTIWRALAPGDLPGPVPEYRFHPVRRWRFDFAWPAARGGVALEVDGGQWKAGGGRHNTDRDREKLNVAAALGWRVLRFSPRTLEDDPAGCVELVAAALVLGGDGGQLGRASGEERAASGRASGADRDAGGGDLRGDPAPVRLTAPASRKLQRGQPLKLARRPGLQLARPQPVKLARRGAAPRREDPAGDLREV